MNWPLVGSVNVISCVCVIRWMGLILVYMSELTGFLPYREVYAVSIVGPFPTAVTNLLDLTRL